MKTLGRSNISIGLSVDTFQDYDRAILGVLDEQGIEDIGVVTGMDFGHTDPQLVLPYGINARIDGSAQTVSVTEPAVTAR